MRMSVGAGFSARDFPVGPTDNTLNHGYSHHEPRIFDNVKPDEMRLPRMIEDEFDAGQVNIRQSE